MNNKKEDGWNYILILIAGYIIGFMLFVSYISGYRHARHEYKNTNTQHISTINDSH